MGVVLNIKGTFHCYLHFLILPTKMADQLVGCYQHVSSENLEEFLETMDIPGPMRSMMANTEPKVEITNDEDSWTVCYKVNIMSITLAFEIDQEFEETHPIMGYKSKNVATITDEDQ